MAGAILNYPAEQFGAMGDKVLYIEENFSSGKESIKSHLLIMPELDSLKIMFNRLGVYNVKSYRRRNFRFKNSQVT
jgi:chemotaxis protein CheC